MNLFAGRGVDDTTGFLREDERVATNWLPVPVEPGDKIVPAPSVEVRVLAYDGDTDPWLVYSYTYHPESNWTHYRPDLSLPSWTNEPVELGFSGWVRVSARWASGMSATDAALPQVELRQAARSEEPLPEHFRQEVERVCARVEELRQPDDLVLLLVADPHVAAGCPWPDTVRNLRAVAERVHPDALVQLGDLTDGLVSKRVARELAGGVLSDLHSLGLPVYGCLGNHDANDFLDNPDRMGTTERTALYLGRQGDPWYYVDFPEQRIRALFLDWYDPERTKPYGFGLEQTIWLRGVLDTLPAGWGSLVFAHGPLLRQTHVWGKQILGEQRVRRLLQRLDRRAGNAVLAYVHGHSHADQLKLLYGFPMVSVGCAKLEDFPEHKPWGATVPHRRAGTASQELWDVVLANARERSVRFVRFGAGEDVEVSRA